MRNKLSLFALLVSLLTLGGLVAPQAAAPAQAQAVVYDSAAAPNPWTGGPRAPVAGANSTGAIPGMTDHTGGLWSLSASNQAGANDPNFYTNYLYYPTAILRERAEATLAFAASSNLLPILWVAGNTATNQGYVAYVTNGGTYNVSYFNGAGGQTVLKTGPLAQAVVAGDVLRFERTPNAAAGSDLTLTHLPVSGTSTVVTVTGDTSAGVQAAGVAALGATNGGPYSAFRVYDLAAASPAGTAFTLTGPASGASGAASSAFTVVPNGPLGAAETVALTSSVAGDVLSPSSLSFASGATAGQTFTLTPSSAGGPRTVTATSSPALGPAPTATYATVAVVLATDPLVHYRPNQWHVSSASATEMETNASGAEFVFALSGATSAALAFDVAAPVVAGAPLRYRVDDLVPVNTTVAASVTVALPDAGPHTVTVSFPYLTPGSEKWTNPASVVRLASITPGSGGSLQAVTGLPSGSLLGYGDSRGGEYVQQDATQGYLYYVATGVGLEPSVRAYSGEGWAANNGTAGGSNTVPFFTPGSPSQSLWANHDSAHSLLVNGKYAVQPAMILAHMGFNDKYSATPASDAAIAASVQGWLGAARAAALTTTPIFVLLDWSGTGRAGVQSGFNAYQSATPDPNARLIDIGVIPGLNGPGPASYLATDRVHPSTPYASAYVAGKIVAAIKGALPGQSGVATNFTAADEATLNAINSQVAKLAFDANNNVKSAPQTSVLLAPAQSYNNTGQTTAPGWAGTAPVLTPTDLAKIEAQMFAHLLATGVTFNRAALDTWGATSGPTTATTSNQVQTTHYYLPDGVTGQHSTVLTFGPTGQPISRTVTTP